MNLSFDGMTALTAGKLIRQKKLGSVELTKHMLQRIQQAEPTIHSFITVMGEQSLHQAAETQARIDSGEELSPLAGVPFAIKDNICMQNAPTTCGSRMLEHFFPQYDATVVEKLSAAGAVPLGKLNLDEFAMGGSTETSFFGPTKNPWDLTRVPGGSSGGSAAAVSAGESFYALGSDTGGSIRQPCSFCGVSGIKPTYGVVSRYGLVAFASSLDQIGPIGRDIADCAAVLQLVADWDPRDSTSIRREPLDFSAAFTGSVEGLRIGIPKAYFANSLDADVAGPVLEAAKTLERLGATVAEFDLALADYAVAAYYVVACAEASSNLSRYDGVKYGFRLEGAESLEELYHRSRSEGFGAEVKRRIMLGSFVLSSGYYDAYYKKALQARRLIQNAFTDAFGRFDMLLSPCAPTAAYHLGENSGDPLKMYLGDIYTVSVNLAGIPAVSIPCGFAKTGMPVGLQLIGPAFSEPALIQAAHTFQLHTDFHTKRPGGGDMR